MANNQADDPIYRGLLKPDCRLCEGIEAQIVDHDDRLLAHGKTGFIRFRGAAGPGESTGPDAAEQPYRDGWLYTGDVATLSEDGEITFKGRSNDVMKIGQARFFAADTENALLAHPKVTAAAAFAWRNQREVVSAAAVTTSSTVTYDELVALCREQIAEHKVPRFILFLTEMPRGSSGRIRKEKIKNILAAQPAPRRAEYVANGEALGWKSGEDVWLETPNFVIRTLKAEDVSDRMLKWWTDPEIVVPLKIRPAKYSRTSFVEFVNSFDNAGRFLLGIFVKDTGLHIGWWELEFNPERRSATLDLAIGDKSFQGRRIVDEMRDVFNEFLFDSVGIYRVEAKIYVDNFRSRRLAESSGYTMEGILATAEVSSDGVRRDMALYRLYDTAWHEEYDSRTANP